MNSIIRDIELSKITGNLNNDSEKIVKYFNDLFNKVILKNSVSSINNILYFLIDDKIIMDIDYDYVLRIKSNELWYFLYDEFGYNISKEIIKYMVNQYLNKIKSDKKALTIFYYGRGINDATIEIYLKNKLKLN